MSKCSRSEAFKLSDIAQIKKTRDKGFFVLSSPINHLGTPLIYPVTHWRGPDLFYDNKLNIF